ncbi:hypothetical protein BC832DRAFT_476596 [Gaertneriomyces semiglobifer]|nr:hypothetical protein BC832DRAFT_397673 [Gaertneriomyces semiglobifer]KAI9005223.1 hypothetical protein BC832DRAFT_476596 [Gaertneriomyces semiglobifer]
MGEIKKRFRHAVEEPQRRKRPFTIKLEDNSDPQCWSEKSPAAVQNWPIKAEGTPSSSNDEKPDPVSDERTRLGTPETTELNSTALRRPRRGPRRADARFIAMMWDEGDKVEVKGRLIVLPSEPQLLHVRLPVHEGQREDFTLTVNNSLRMVLDLPSGQFKLQWPNEDCELRSADNRLPHQYHTISENKQRVVVFWSQPGMGHFFLEVARDLRNAGAVLG